jgi:regulator of sigma E protease
LSGIALALVPSFVRIIEVAIGIGFVIFVHELGHFLVAKWAGIRVEVFSLGFGPRLLGFRRGDTDYRLSAVPLGGYVKMAGENPDDPRAGADDEFAAKSVGARAAVISAGVVMNGIFAVVLFLAAFKIGVQMVAPVVGDVLPESPAAQAGLSRGDEIVAIDGEAPLDFVDVGLAAAFAGDGGVEITLRRRGALLPPIRVRPRRELGKEYQQLGISPIDEVASLVAGGAAEKAGLRPGDRIIGLGGKALESRSAFDAAVFAHPGEPLEIEVWRAGAIVPLTLVPAKRPARTYGIELSERPAIIAITPGSPAAKSGLAPGDVVAGIGGVEPKNAAQAIALVRDAPAGKPLAIEVERAGKRRTIEVTPVIDPARNRQVVGMVLDARLVRSVAPGSAAARAGIEPGARILSIEAPARIFAGADYDQIASLAGEAKTTLRFEDPQGKEHEVSLAGDLVPGKWFGDGEFDSAPAEFRHRVAGAWQPIALGFTRTWMFMKQVGLTIKGMFEKRIDTRTLGGPIAIGQGAYNVASRGFGSLLYFLAVISVNLAVLNILPIPILDGGHLVFLGIEKAKGSPVAPNVQAAAQWVGLVLLLGLMVFVTKNDIVRLLGG